MSVLRTNGPLVSSCDENGINTCLNDFVSIFDDVCEPILKKTKPSNSCNEYSLKRENALYTDEKKNKKQHFHFYTF